MLIAALIVLVLFGLIAYAMVVGSGSDEDIRKEWEEHKREMGMK